MKLLIHPLLQRCNRWSLLIDKLFHSISNWVFDYLFMFGSKFVQVDKRDPRWWKSPWRFLLRCVHVLEVILKLTQCQWGNPEENKHYDDVIMGTLASQITSLTIVYSALYSGADQSNHQSSASLAFVWRIHRGPVNSPHKWPVTRKMSPFDDVIMSKIRQVEKKLKALCENSHYFADDIFKWIFLKGNLFILTQISSTFISRSPFNNKTALFQVMRRIDDKPSFESNTVYRWFICKQSTFRNAAGKKLQIERKLNHPEVN